MTKTVIILVIFFLAGWFLFTYKLTDVPPGINGDEASIGYNAALVAKNGYDQNGKFLPIFVSTPEKSDWKQPITFYSTVLAFKIFGPSYTMLKEVSVILILTSSLLIFLLVKEILGLKEAFVSLLMFFTIPTVMIQSHLALENIAPIPFTVLWLLMLARYKNTLKQRFLLLAGLALGINLFSYTGMRIIFPTFFLLSIWLILKLNKNLPLKVNTSILIFSMASLIFPLFLLSIRREYPGAILQNNRLMIIPSYQEFILPYLSSFDPSFLFIKGDLTPYHSTGKQGVFLLATLPIFLLGILKIIQKKDFFLSFILMTFFLTPLFYGFAGSIHRGSRLLVLLPFYTIIATLGFMRLFDIKNILQRYLLLTLAVLLIAWNYSDFVNDYWYEYPQRVRSEFAKPYQLVFERAAKLSQDKKLTVYLQNDFGQENIIARDFFKQVYFNGTLKIWKSENLPGNSIIIVSDDILPKYKDFKQEKINDYGFGLLINDMK